MPNQCPSILFSISALITYDRYSHKANYPKFICFSLQMFVLQQIRALSSSELSMARSCCETVHTSQCGIQGHVVWPLVKRLSPSQQKPVLLSFQPHLTPNCPLKKPPTFMRNLPNCLGRDKKILNRFFPTVSEVKTFRLKEVVSFAQGHTACRGRHQYSNPGLTSKPRLLPVLHYSGKVQPSQASVGKQELQTVF